MLDAMQAQTETRKAARYIDAAEAAKMLRADLKAAFSGVKFSVRTHRYSMGCSLRVHWTDGPSRRAVERVTSFYESASFDGMTDSTSYHDATLPSGERVRFGCNYVTTSRDISNEAEKIATAVGIINEMCAVDGDRYGTRRVLDLAIMMVYGADEDGLLPAFRRVVLRETDEE